MLWPGTKPVSKVTLYILDVPGRRLSGWNLSGTFHGLIEKISEVVNPEAVGIFLFILKTKCMVISVQNSSNFTPKVNVDDILKLIGSKMFTKN